jgi:GxxExxY protein
MIVESVVLLEFKAGDRLDPSAEAQLLNYLRASRLQVGLLLRFGSKASFKRRVITNDRKIIP